MRALQGWGIFLVQCERSESKEALTAGICVIDLDDPPSNPVVVVDIDTQAHYQLTLPEQLTAVSYRVELRCAAV
jgi:hypothetical protein